MRVSTAAGAAKCTWMCVVRQKDTPRKWQLRTSFHCTQAGVTLTSKWHPAIERAAMLPQLQEEFLRTDEIEVNWSGRKAAEMFTSFMCPCVCVRERVYSA